MKIPGCQHLQKTFGILQVFSFKRRTIYSLKITWQMKQRALCIKSKREQNVKNQCLAHTKAANEFRVSLGAKLHALCNFFFSFCIFAHPKFSQGFANSKSLDNRWINRRQECSLCTPEGFFLVWLGGCWSSSVWRKIQERFPNTVVFENAYLNLTTLDLPDSGCATVQDETMHSSATVQDETMHSKSATIVTTGMSSVARLRVACLHCR